MPTKKTEGHDGPDNHDSPPPDPRDGDERQKQIDHEAGHETDRSLAT